MTPARPEADGDLTRRALAGDRTAWDVLIARHDHRVVMSLVARGTTLDRARDIAQQAWLRLVEQQRDGRLERIVMPGLAIAQARFLDLEAARRRDGGDDLPLDEARWVADETASIEGRIIGREQLARAEAVLSRCSAAAQKVFRLVYGSTGLSHAEVAQRVDLSLQRVRQILCEVRKQLRVVLEEKEP